MLDLSTILFVFLLCLFALSSMVLWVLVSMDMVSYIRLRLSQYRMGWETDPDRWRAKVTCVVRKWIDHTPSVPVTDSTRLIAIDKWRGTYWSATTQHWQEAGLILGLSEVMDVKDAASSGTIQDFLHRTFDETGMWRKPPEEIDGAILAYAVMKIPSLDVSLYRKSFDYMAEKLHAMVGEDGTVMYRKNHPSINFIDTIGLVCPFLALYGVAYNDDQSIELAIKQITLYAEHAALKSTFLLPHCYDFSAKTPLGVYGWGRGMGWFALGLIDTLGELDESYPQSEEMSAIVKTLADCLLQYQRNDGGWNAFVTHDFWIGDSSATAMLGWFLLFAYEQNRDERYRESVERSMEYLMKVTQRNGVLDYSQGDTKDIGLYSSRFEKMPFAQGMCLRLSSAFENQTKRLK